MIEANVKSQVKRTIADIAGRVTGFKPWAYWPVQTGYGVHGIPDCLMSFAGLIVGIETKVDCKEPTTRQWQQLFAIQDSGGIALVIDQHNIADVVEVLHAITRGDHVAAKALAAINIQTYPAHV